MTARRLLAAFAVAGLWITLGQPVAVAGDADAQRARRALSVAEAAANAWAGDAVLVYVENDEDLDADGRSTRWGYLYHSPGRNMSRVYSIHEDDIVVASDLDMAFAAPPVASAWIDSDHALRAAETESGAAFRAESGGALSHMVLVRGVFDLERPDATTWTVVYTAPDAPSLFVVVDATTGRVTRTYRG